MSEVMTPMSFEQLVEWVLQEKKKRGTVFGQHHAYRADGVWSVFDNSGAGRSTAAGGVECK